MRTLLLVALLEISELLAKKWGFYKKMSNEAAMGMTYLFIIFLILDFIDACAK